MINFLVGLGASIGVVIVYSLLKVASDFDDEVDEMYKEYDYYDNCELNKKYNYYEDTHRKNPNKDQYENR